MIMKSITYLIALCIVGLGLDGILFGQDGSIQNPFQLALPQPMAAI